MLWQRILRSKNSFFRFLPSRCKILMENAASLWPDPPAWWKEEPGEPPPLPEGDITVFGVSRGVGAPPLPDLDDQR